MGQSNVKSGWLKKAYFGLVKGENFLGNFLLLIIRLYWGSQLVMTGIGKFGNLHSVADFFATLNIPAPIFMATLVAICELLGGISLFLGLYARIFSVILSAVFIIAYATAHSDALMTIFITPNVFLTEAPFLFLYASLIVLCFGSGFISFDYWIERKAYGHKL